jgi:hypothetical protein
VSPGAEDANVTSGDVDPDAEHGDGVVSAPALTDVELRAGWQELSVPGPGQVEAIAKVPDGYLALRRESVGDGKVGLFQSHLYRSADGVAWSEVSLPGEHPNFGLRGLGYSNGHYVLAGDRFLLTSNDGSQWTEQELSWNDGSTLASVVVSNGRFFVLGTFRRMLSSSDGQTWTDIDMLTLQQSGVTFGKGKYLLTGVGPIQTSLDGLQWQGTLVSCDLPDACVTNPDGVSGPGPFAAALFVDGRFYTGQLVSDDGLDWRVSGEPYAEWSADGSLFGSGTSPGSLSAWRPGSAALDLDVRAPSEGNAGLPSGESCETKRCVLLGDRLFLVR